MIVFWISSGNCPMVVPSLPLPLQSPCSFLPFLSFSSLPSLAGPLWPFFFLPVLLFHCSTSSSCLPCCFYSFASCLHSCHCPCHPDACAITAVSAISPASFLSPNVLATGYQFNLYEYLSKGKQENKKWEKNLTPFPIPCVCVYLKAQLYRTAFKAFQ